MVTLVTIPTFMNRIPLLLIAITVFTTTVKAQPLKDWNFTRFTSADGLSDNIVTGVAEDSTGFLWLSTRAGLNRFNGHHFVQYHSTDDSASLSSEELAGMYRLDDHRLAVVGSGVHIINTRTGHTKNIFIPYKNERYVFKLNMTLQAVSDEKGDLFVLSRSGFYHFNDKDSLVYRFDYYSDSLVALRHLVFGGKMLWLDESRLMIKSVNGLYLYDKKRKSFQKIKPGEIPKLDDFLSYPKIPFAYFELRPGVFFIYDPEKRRLCYVDIHTRENNIFSDPFPEGMGEPAWRSKLIAINKNSFVLTLQQAGMIKINFDVEKGTGPVILPQTELSQFVCNDVIQDHEGRLIVATNKGLLRQQMHSRSVETSMLDRGASFADATFDDVVRLGDKVYAATRGAGLAVFNRTDLRFEKLISLSDNDPEKNIVSALQPTRENELLIGTMATPFSFDIGTRRLTELKPPGWINDHYWVHNISRDNQGNALISAHKIYRYNFLSKSFDLLPELPQLLDAPVSIQEDHDGNLWMARHGLARFNTSKGKYDRYVDSFPFIKMADKQVATFTIDKNNTIWLGIHNNGLVSYSPSSGKFRHFTRKNGLPNDQISSLYYLNNRVWIAGFAGIASIDIEDFSVNNYGPQDGFPASSVNSGARFFYDSLEHLFYIGFADAIARFDPGEISQKVSAPKIFIERVMINGREQIYLPGPAVYTAWNRRQLRISIGDINFFDGGTQRFAYRFAAAEDQSWIDLGPETSFSISGLSAGKHRLEVRVSSGGNRWPEQIVSLNIIVAAPFWLKPWFFMICALTISGMIFILVRWRTSVARRKEMVNTQIEKLRAEDYKAQFELEQITHYFSSSLAGKKTEDEIVADVAERLIASLHYEDCIIYLWDHDKTKMIQKAAVGPKNENDLIKTSGFSVMPGQGIVGHVIDTKKPLLVNDTRKDARYRVDDRFRLSELTVPVLHNGELLGVIDSEHSRANYFNERDIKIMTTIATLLGNKLKQLESEQSLEAKQIELAGINEQLAEARLSALQAQMNPHFVFNALNSIKRMILEGENDTASRYLSKFALMIRMTLEHSKETFVTLHDNVQYLKAYLEMERLRFDQTFTYLIDVDESVDDSEISLPSMMIQPLVENAIWHGLMYTDTEKMLKISFAVVSNRLRCVVEDNGMGIRQSEELRRRSRTVHRSVGLENLRKRIGIMNEKYQTDCTLTITDLKEAGETGPGTRAVLEMNIVSA